MKPLYTFLLSSLTASALSVGITHYVMKPETQAQTIADMKADLLAHPEFLQQLADAYQNQQVTQQQANASQLVFEHLDAVKDGLLVKTQDKAPVTVVEFFDYQCIFCSKLAPVINRLQDDNQLQFVFHETPIFRDRWTQSELAAEVGNALYQFKGVSAYDRYHRALFATEHTEGQLTQQDITKALSDVSVSLDDLTLSEHQTNESLTLFQELGFQGTPALIVMPTENPTPANIHVIFGADPAKLQQAIADVKKVLS